MFRKVDAQVSFPKRSQLRAHRYASEPISYQSHQGIFTFGNYNPTKSAILNNINETEWSPAFYQNQHGVSWRNDDISWLVKTPPRPHSIYSGTRPYSPEGWSLEEL